MTSAPLSKVYRHINQYTIPTFISDTNKCRLFSFDADKAGKMSFILAD